MHARIRFGWAIGRSRWYGAAIVLVYSMTCGCQGDRVWWTADPDYAVPQNPRAPVSFGMHPRLFPLPAHSLMMAGVEGERYERYDVPHTSHTIDCYLQQKKHVRVVCVLLHCFVLLLAVGRRARWKKRRLHRALYECMSKFCRRICDTRAVLLRICALSHIAGARCPHV